MKCLICGEEIELDDEAEGTYDGYMALWEDVNDLEPMGVVHSRNCFQSYLLGGV